MGSMGSKKAADSEAQAAAGLASQGPKWASDMSGLRSDLSRFFQNQLPDMGFSTPQMEMLNRRMSQVASPEFMRGVMQEFDPMKGTDYYRSQTEGQHNTDLQQMYNAVQGQFGPTGNRMGSAVANSMVRGGNDATNQREARLGDMFTGLQQNQIGALGLIPGLLGGLSSAYGAQSQNQLGAYNALLGNATNLATAGTGFTPTGGLAPYLGASGSASGMNALAGSLSMFPLYQTAGIFGGGNTAQPKLHE